MRAVLLEWMRAAELSCDRAATLAVRDPQIVCRTLMVIAGGIPADQLDLDAFMAQAMEYENWEDSHDRVRRFFNEINVTHANAVRRVSEVMRWVQSGEYDRIMRGEYRRRGEETNVREEAGDAMEFYAERFRAMFRELGDNVTTLGNQMGDASQQRRRLDPQARSGGSAPVAASGPCALPRGRCRPCRCPGVRSVRRAARGHQRGCAPSGAAEGWSFSLRSVREADSAMHPRTRRARERPPASP